MLRHLSFILVDDVDRRVVTEATGLAGRVLGFKTSLRTTVHCDEGFDTRRGQWRAEAMLQACVAPYASPDSFVVALTTKDLYAQSLNFVFGLASARSGAAIVSLHRLLGGGTERAVGRVAKEIIHEVGHLEGLDHCKNEACVMWFSNSLSETDRKPVEFCSTCRAKRSPEIPPRTGATGT